jgi:hypothetical protein
VQHAFERQILDLRIVDHENGMMSHIRVRSELGSDAVSIQNCHMLWIAAT